MEKEKRDFVIKWALGWGFTTAILFSFISAFFEPGGFYKYAGFHFEWFWGQLVIAIFVFPIVGFFAGLWFWKRQEKRK